MSEEESTEDPINDDEPEETPDRDELWDKVYASTLGQAAYSQSRIAHNVTFSKAAEKMCKEVERLRKDDEEPIEQFYIAQAGTLHTVFSDFMTRAVSAEYIERMEKYSAIALRAQAQCTRTLKALVEARNPARGTYIAQQNNAVNQQINDGRDPITAPEPRKKSANKLLEVNHDARLDIGATGATTADDSHLEAVGEVYGTKD